MAKRTLILILSCLLITGVACKKYEDGPLISLKTKKKRLVGKWEIVEVDGIAYPKGRYEEFNDDGAYSYSIDTTQIETGRWTFGDNKGQLELWWDGGGGSHTRDILRLTSGELWYMGDGYKSPLEYHLEKR